MVSFIKQEAILAFETLVNDRSHMQILHEKGPSCRYHGQKPNLHAKPSRSQDFSSPYIETIISLYLCIEFRISFVISRYPNYGSLSIGRESCIFFIVCAEITHHEDYVLKLRQLQSYQGVGHSALFNWVQIRWLP